jgi:regulatory protein
VAKITALKVSRGRGKRVKVFLDGKITFSLETEVALKEGLKVGQELSDGQIENLNGANNYQLCYDAAARYLSYRLRSEYELRKRLIRRGFNEDNIDAVLTKLKEQGLINDCEFAQFWKDNRQAFSPRSQWLTRLELKQKGVPNEVIEQVISTIDDADNAYRAATNRARRLTIYEYQSFRRRLGEYLRRRGFGYGVINKTIERLWQERGVA